LKTRDGGGQALHGSLGKPMQIKRGKVVEAGERREQKRKENTWIFNQENRAN